MFITSFFFYLFQLTYADTHPMFTARSFPHFFRIVPSESQFNEPRLALLREFNWTRLGTLYQNEAKFSLVSHRHKERLPMTSPLRVENAPVVKDTSASSGNYFLCQRCGIWAWL
jgi:Receptor family ligand binding region